MPSVVDEQIYVVTHVDIMPNHTAAGAKLLGDYGARSRKDPGVLRFEILREPARPNHFTIVSVWADQAAFEGHLIAEHTRKFRGELQPLLGSPFDERLHRLFV